MIKKLKLLLYFAKNYKKIQNYFRTFISLKNELTDHDINTIKNFLNSPTGKKLKIHIRKIYFENIASGTIASWSNQKIKYQAAGFINLWAVLETLSAYSSLEIANNYVTDDAEIDGVLGTAHTQD